MQMKKIAAGLLMAVLVASTLMTGCAQKAAGGDAQTPDYPKKPMEFIAPAGAGGGWDLTIRTVSKTLQDTKLVPVPMPVTNRPGGGGGVKPVGVVVIDKDAVRVEPLKGAAASLVDKVADAAARFASRDKAAPAA